MKKFRFSEAKITSVLGRNERGEKVRDLCRELGISDEGRRRTLSPDEKRMLVKHMNEEHGVSIRQGCRAAGLARSTYRYEARPKRDEEVIDALNALMEKHPSIGFWQAYHRLRRAGLVE